MCLRSHDTVIRNFTNIEPSIPIVTVSSVTATSVTVTWKQFNDIFVPESYMIILTRVVGSEQALCPDVEDSRYTKSDMFAMQFIRLHEFSSYELRITPNYKGFGSMSSSMPGSTIFNTAPAGMLT